MTRILIVEDEARLASFVEKGLKRQGFEAHVAEDGQQALQCLSQQAFDVVLLDLSLPIFDGWTVLRKLRQDGSTVPIIIVTALLDEGDLPRVLAAGANDYLRKPFRFTDLMAMVQKYK